MQFCLSQKFHPADKVKKAFRKDLFPAFLLLLLRAIDRSAIGLLETPMCVFSGQPKKKRRDTVFFCRDTPSAEEGDPFLCAKKKLVCGEGECKINVCKQNKWSGFRNLSISIRFLFELSRWAKILHWEWDWARWKKKRMAWKEAGVFVCVCYPLRWEKRTHEPLISEGIFILFYLLKSAGAFEFRNYYNNSSPRRDQKWCGRERKRMGSWLIFRAEFVVGFGSVWALNSPEPIRRSLYRCFTWSGKIFAILNNLAQLW